MKNPREKLYRYGAWAIFAAVFVLILLTFRSYGITWDEELQSQYGQAIVDYYFSGLEDRRYDEIFNLYLYGGMFDGLASLVDRYTPFLVYDTRHLLNALFGLLGLWGTWRLGRLMGGGSVGFIALSLLALTPMYYGHMFNNPKDIPFAAGIVWTIYFMGRCMAERPRPEPALLLRLGIILGLTLGIRIGGAMVLCFWGVPVAWAAVRRLYYRSQQTHLSEALRAIIRDEIRFVVPATFIAYVVMLICWPWAQENPILNPLRALSEFSNFPQDVEVLLDGTIYKSTQLPWTYVPLYFGIQLPEISLLLLASFFFLLPYLWRRMDLPRKETLLLILLMAFLPMLYAVIRRPALYDAVRHFLFAVPLICVLCALASRQIFRFCVGHFETRRGRRIVGAGLVAVLLISASTQVAIMAQLHPYEYIYANRFAGGVSGAFGHYEMDYWGSSFKEAAEDLQAYMSREGGVPPGKIYKIAICGPWDSAMIYLPPDYEPVLASEPAEFFLSTTRWMCQNMRPGLEVVRVTRMGVPLSVIKDLRDPAERRQTGIHAK